MIQVSTHLFGSTDGYQTLAKSADVSEAEERALSIFGFGSPQSPQEIEQLQHRPSVAGKLLPSGRFAITRLFPGGPDVAGRDTVERRSIIFTAQQWKSVVQCDLESLLADDHAFARDAFANASAHSVQVRDSDDLLPHAGELERHVYDILLSTPRQNCCSLLPDEAANRRALMRLLKLLPAQDACQLSWGLGLFAATPGVRIATASASVPASPQARWPSLTAQLAHPNKVATLGMSLDFRATMRGVAIAQKTPRMSLRQRMNEYLAWIIVACVLLSIALGYFIFASRPQKSTQPLPANAMQVPTPPTAITKLEILAPVVPETKQVATEPAASEDKSATTTATATTSNDSSSPSAAKPTSAPGGEVQPATLASTPTENNAVSQQTVASQVGDIPKEPVNAFTENSKLWFQARELFTKAQIPTPKDPLPLAELATIKEQAEALNELEKTLIAHSKKIAFNKPILSTGFTLADRASNQTEANLMFQASLLLLAECDILSAKEAILLNIMDSSENAKKIEIQKIIGKTELPQSMEKWIDKIGANKQPKDLILKHLDSQIRGLLENTIFPIQKIAIPATRKIDQPHTP